VLVVGVSIVVQPKAWADWVRFLAATPEGGSVAQFQIPIPLVLRLPIAAALVAWGARTDQCWTVPVGAAVALPILWASGLGICAALAPGKQLSARSTGPH
jgi:hypothetical protein